MVDKIKTKFRGRFRNRPGYIFEGKLRDWNGTTVFKFRTAQSDTINTGLTLKTIAEKMGIANRYSNTIEDAWLKRVGKLMQESQEEEKAKIKKYLGKN